MKKCVYIFMLFLAGHALHAQQLPLYSQYLYNKFLINPAVAGSDGFTSFNLTAREQWIGYNGAPRTYSFSWQNRILKRGYQLRENIFNKTVYRAKTEGRAGYGAYFFSDRNGLVHRTGFQGAYTYHIWVADYTQLSMGLAFTGYHFRIDANDKSFEDQSEPWLNNNLRRGVFIPDFDFGINILDPGFEVGLSAQQMLGAIAKLGEVAYRNYWMDRHFYLFGSYNFYSGTKIELKPSLLVKMSGQLRPQVDLGLTYTFDQSFWAGLSYRTGSSLVANIGFRHFNNRVKLTTMYFGYSFDFTLNKIQSVTYGTHEFTMALKIGDRLKRFRWIDRF